MNQKQVKCKLDLPKSLALTPEKYLRGTAILMPIGKFEANEFKLILTPETKIDPKIFQGKPVIENVHFDIDSQNYGMAAIGSVLEARIEQHALVADFLLTNQDVILMVINGEYKSVSVAVELTTGEPDASGFSEIKEITNFNHLLILREGEQAIKEALIASKNEDNKRSTMEEKTIENNEILELKKHVAELQKSIPDTEKLRASLRQELQEERIFEDVKKYASEEKINIAAAKNVKEALEIATGQTGSVEYMHGFLAAKRIFCAKKETKIEAVEGTNEEFTPFSANEFSVL